VLFALETILFAYFGLSVVFTLISVIAAKFRNVKAYESDPNISLSRIAILIPAYKEDAIIEYTISSMMELEYSKDFYQVFLIADSFDSQTIEKAKTYPINVVEVSFEKSTKAKSLDFCLNQINPDAFDLVLISDADNILEKDFLSKVNVCYHNGNKVIQANRVAKNVNGPVAMLDAVSEAINNTIYRKGQNAIGLSSCLIGSGMVFELGFFKKILKDALHSVGEDRIFQLKAVEAGYKIYYLEDAKIYDEKVASFKNFQNQRKRWIASQFKYLVEHFPSATAFLLKGNISYFSMAIINNLFLPRILNLGSLFLLSLIHIIFLGFSEWTYAWIVLLITFTSSLFLGIPTFFFKRKDFWMSILNIPVAFFSMLKALLGIKGASSTFINTEHNVEAVDTTLFNSNKK